MVSARMLPITNAPKAALKPTSADRTAMKQHSPSDTISSVSPVMKRRTERRNSGTAKMPTTNHSTRKNTMLTTLPSSWLPLMASSPATAERSTIITMARMSSRMSTLITIWAKACCRRPMSSKAL